MYHVSRDVHMKRQLRECKVEREEKIVPVNCCKLLQIILYNELNVSSNV